MLIACWIPKGISAKWNAKIFKIFVSNPLTTRLRGSIIQSHQPNIGVHEMASKKEIFEYAYRAGSLGFYKENPFNAETQPFSHKTFKAGYYAGCAEKVQLSDTREVCTAKREAAYAKFLAE